MMRGRGVSLLLALAATGAAAQSPSPSPPPSRVLGERDMTLRGRPACEIRFVYAGHPPETLFWEEPCAAVTAQMATRADLEALDRWVRLDAFAQRFVTAMPGGRVLMVEGGFSASIYPIGTEGKSYEIAVAD